jgi:hypothetical protein
MALIEVPIPNLLGGVSQQPPANRQPGQVEACDNALLHVVNGAGKRKGSRHIAKLVDGLESVLTTHIINRDEFERYVVLLGERRARVFSALDGTEFPVFVNGTTTHAGRGETGSGAPINYLDPRTPDGVVDQDEDFVIGAGDWLTVAANSVTTYLAGRGPFRFGRRQSTSAVTADTVAEVGNDAAASVSDIYQTFGTFARRNLASVFIKKSSSAINDVELVLSDATFARFAGARFDISPSGVVTVGALVTTDGSNVTAEVETFPDGWYRASVRVSASVGLPPPGALGVTEARRIRLRFHTNAATPANKRALLFGARLYDNVLSSQPVPDYVVDRSDLVRAVTVADTTFLLNTETTVAPVGGSSGSGLGGGTRAVVFVKAGGQTDVPYTLVLRKAGGPDRTYTYTPATLANASTENIAAQLVILINAAGFFSAVSNVGSSFLIQNGTEALADIVAHDGRGDTLLIAFLSSGGQVARFTDLPLVLASGTQPIAQVVGTTADTEDDFYVQFVLNNAGSTTDGHWEETTAPAIPNTLDAASLPQALSRRQDDAAGTVTGVPNAVYFDVSPIAWDQRLVGSVASNPDPSFVGHKVRDVFLYRGRLGLLSEDNVILSEAGEVFNFFRTTVLDLPDTDPIDIDSGTRDVVLFRNAAATADSLLLFSDRHQFQLLGDPTLTPASAQLAPVRAFENLVQAHPVDTGRGVVFARFDQTFSGLMEANLLQDDLTFRFDDLSVQAPRFIVGAARELAHSSLMGLTVACAGQGQVLYVHQSFRDDQENRLQSALHRWVFDDDTQVRGVGFLDTELRLIVERGEGWFLETVQTDTETTENGRPITYLDRRLDAGSVVRVYDGPTDTTTLTLPYDISPTADMRVVDAATGLMIPITGQGTDTLEVHGDVSASSLFIGEAYAMAITLSQPVIQAASPRGGLIPRTGRPLSVNRLYVYVSDTAFLECQVAESLRDTSSEEFSAAGLGTGLLLEGELTLVTGDADFSIIGLSTEFSATLRNETPFPSFIQSGRWEVLNHQRSVLS